MEDPDVTEMKKNCNNREYVLQAVKGKGKLLEFAAPEFHDDEEHTYNNIYGSYIISHKEN